MTLSRGEGGARDVIVVGAGVGGLACALALHARGARPLVLEREPALRAAGAGLQLGPNAVRVLSALGLGEPLRALGGEARDAVIRRGRDGRRLSVTRFSQAEARWGAPYLQVLRSDLQALLREAVDARNAAEVRLGAEVVATDGERGELVLATGERLSADVVVAADGLRGATGVAVPGPAAPRPLGQTAWRALLPTDRLPAELMPAATEVRIGGGAHLVAYPVDFGRRLNLVAVVDDAGRGPESWTELGDPAAWLRAFEGWAEPAPAWLGALEARAVWRGALYDRPPRRRWSHGRVVLLGDAAHPTSPSFAQGAAMAIEDAWVLADALARLPRADAFEAYAAARRARTARVQRQSRLNARLFHLPEVLSSAVFRVAEATARDGGLARFDWLYGGGPVPAPG